MQNEQRYGHPRLPMTGTILMMGALRSVASMNFHLSCTPGSDGGCAAADTRTPMGRCREQSSRTAFTVPRSVNPNT